MELLTAPSSEGKALAYVQLIKRHPSPKIQKAAYKLEYYLLNKWDRRDNQETVSCFTKPLD